MIHERDVSGMNPVPPLFALDNPGTNGYTNPDGVAGD